MSKNWRMVCWVVLGALGTGLAVTVIYALLQGAQSSQSGEEIIQAVRETQVDNHKLLDTIQDCTQPTGQCFKAGQKRTGDAVASINRVVILAAACAVGKTGTEVEVQAQIQACVIEGLARQNARHPTP